VLSAFEWNGLSVQYLGIDSCIEIKYINIMEKFLVLEAKALSQKRELRSMLLSVGI
jgi:hypothetical protein